MNTGVTQAVLVVFCRQPQRGVGKQRLAKTIGTDAALHIAEQLWNCVAEDLQHWPGPAVIAPASPADRVWAEKKQMALQEKRLKCGLDLHMQVLPQEEGNLGERLNGVDLALRRQSHERLIFIGSDAPSLDVAPLCDLAAQLVRHDAAFLPARDGGVVAMAARRPWPALAALPWSSAQLGASLLETCRSAGWSCYQGGAHSDLDELADIPALYAELAADARPARIALRASLRPWCSTGTGPLATQTA